MQVLNKADCSNILSASQMNAEIQQYKERNYLPKTRPIIVRLQHAYCVTYVTERARGATNVECLLGTKINTSLREQSWILK